MDHLTTIKHRLHQLAHLLLNKEIQVNVKHGPRMALMHTMLTLQWSTTEIKKLGPNNTTFLYHRVASNIYRPLQRTYNFGSRSDADCRRRASEGDPTGRAHEKLSQSTPCSSHPKIGSYPQ